MVLNVGWQRSREKDSIFEGFGLGGTEGGSEGSCAYCGVVFGGKGGKAERIWFRGGFLRDTKLAKEELKRPPQTNRWGKRVKKQYAIVSSQGSVADPLRVQKRSFFWLLWGTVVKPPLCEGMAYVLGRWERLQRVLFLPSLGQK